MSQIPADQLRGISHRPVRTLAVATVVAFLLLSPVSPLFSPVSSDPGYIDNGDDTRSVLWNFTDATDYDLYNSSVSGGLGRIGSVNETTGENSTAQYLLGTGTNLDLLTAPDSMIIDNSLLAVQTLPLQPGPEGKDNYLDGWWWPYPATDGSDLSLNSMWDPNDAYNKRYHVIMQFDLSSVPAGATILDAELLLYEKGGKVEPLTYTIRAVNSSWDEIDVSWTYRDAGHTWENQGGDHSTDVFSSGIVDGTNGWHSFDLTRLVDLWTRGIIPNYGFVIIADPTPDDRIKIFTDCESTNKPDQRPRLVIDYTLGEATGSYESAPLGPGTNSTFTLANWYPGTFSKASDEFAGSSLSPKWSWTLDPVLTGGSVNFDRNGWLNITGSQSTYLPNASEECNFLHQNITGDFVAEWRLQTYFSSDTMGAGLMMMNDALTWLAVYATGVQGSQQVIVEVSNGTRHLVNSTSWTSTLTFLQIERSDASYQFKASADGTDWTTIGSYAPNPRYDFGLAVELGPFVFSGGSALQPTVEFDYVRILPAGQTTVLEISARTGNSTSLIDPSWSAWSAPLSPSTGALIGSPGKYIQYKATLRTTCDWVSPVMSGFECHYERFCLNGTIITREVAPAAFLAWESMTVTQTLWGGDVQYFYSIDHGSSWTSLGSGSSFALSISVATIMIRAELTTEDTSVTPSIDTIELVYRITHASFYVVAPATVPAGEPFSIYIEPKDTGNNTATWTGTVTLNAVDSSGTGEASSELSATQAVVPDGGHLTVTNVRYYAAETIRVFVSGGGATGISEIITVTPGPASSITIEPAVTRLLPNSYNVFTASLCDAFGNNLTGASFAWQADIGLGLLNATTGNSVNLTTVEMESSGYLTVTSGSITGSMFIIVSALTAPPHIDPDIPTQTKLEDFGSWTFDLGPYVSDREDNNTELRWYTVNETFVKVTGENHTGNLFITFTTVQDMFGVNLLELWVVDSDRMSSKAILTVDIIAVNDAPTIDPIDPIVVRYDDPYQYNLGFYVRDVETPSELLTLSVDPVSAPYVQVSNMWMTLLYPQRLNGTQQTVFLSVSDGEYSASTVIQVAVTDNYAPRTLGALPDQFMYQGDIKLGAFDLDNYFTDPDSSNLYYTNANTHVAVLIQLDHTVDFYAPNNWAGQEYIVFIAKDARGARAESALQMNVLAVNQPPTISDVPDLVVRFGKTYDFDLSPYLEDIDNDIGGLIVSVSDPHAWTFGTLLSMLFPSAMTGQTVQMNITVSDGLLSDWWTINVTISSDFPPELTTAAPDHSFLEDNALDYPVLGHIDDFFLDPDAEPLTYSAFVSVSNVTAEVIAVGNNWSIRFTPERNWNGMANLTFRATDDEGALAETTVLLTVKSVPDQPLLSLPESFTATQGSRSLIEVTRNVTDPDSVLTDFRWTLDCAYPDFVTIHGGIIVFDFPVDFLDGGEKSRTFTLTVSVSDQDNLMSTDNMTITVTKSGVVTKQSPALLIGLLGFAGAAGVLSVYAVVRRKKPFVIRDLMLIHNDGFLMSRYASHTEGEIDEDIMTSMLTAVLNFVEDSMATNQEDLRTFGFKDYRVIVERGEKCFAAIVFEGDAPEHIEKPMKDLVDTVERLYKKKLVRWTGDIETDFPGIELLIQAFVKENSKKARSPMESIWRAGPVKRTVTPRKVTMDQTTEKTVEPGPSPAKGRKIL